MVRVYSLVSVLLAGCSATGPTYHAEVKPILEGRCVSCHQQGGVGPFLLDSFEAAHAVAPAIAASVAGRQMPPWPAASGHQTYLRDRSLTDAQIDTIVAWAEAGALEGDVVSAPPLPDLSVALPRVDAVLQMPEPYSPRNQPDDYRCFVLDWPEETERYIVGYEAFPDNGAIVHHSTAFLIRPDTLLGESVFDTLASWSGADGSPGYTCFGGPSGTEELAIPIQQLGGWVPGSGAVLFPEGVGIPVPPGSKVVLQMHYNLDAADDAPDQSSIHLMLSDEVDRVGAFAPWLDPSWPLGGMEIPPGVGPVTHEAVGSPYALFNLVLGDSIDLTEGFWVHSAMLHMHRRGVAAETSVLFADGREEVLLEIPRWQFGWQLDYALEAPVFVGPDDHLSVTCTYENTGTEMITWGEGSSDEMCVSNLFIAEP